MKSNMKSVVIGGIVLLVGIAVIGFRFVGTDSEQPLAVDTPVQERADIPPQATGTVRQLEPQTALSFDEASKVTVDAGENPRADDSDYWSDRFHSTTDFWKFVDAAAPAAAAGDARAQFLVAEALGECNGTVARYQKNYAEGMSPVQIFENAFWKMASPSVPAVYVELSRRNFMKCAEFFNGDPPKLDQLEIGSEANTRDYWLALALENGDPVAVMQDAYMLAARLDSIPADLTKATLEKIEGGISRAIESRDPEALFRLGVLIAYVGSTDPAESPAWTLAACESGYDCSYANPAIGGDCVALGLCAGGGSIALGMQQNLGALYGTAYARSQEIIFELERGEASSIADTLLAQLNLGE